MYRILVSDPVAEEGLTLLRGHFSVDARTELTEDQLVDIIGEYDALVVRSGTQVTGRIIEAGKKLKIIGRAGTGVDNIEVESATKRGIPVVNAPEGNTLAATEHTIAMMLALARNIPQANASLRKRQWKRSKFIGFELNEKALGILGLGRIGREVAKRAIAMDMRCLAYDPFISAERARALGVELMPLDEVIQKADVITVHTPLTKETTHLINAERIARMKDGVRIVNCARGGIIDEKALYEGLKSGKIAGAAIDVFEEEPPLESPLLEMENVVATPHLGASTVEAQQNVAITVAKEIITVLQGGVAKYAVNVPAIPPELQDRIEPYALLAEKMGRFLIQLLEGRLETVDIVYGGEIGQFSGNTRIITRHV
jgi:D-3-phosphoglycerate dehydrogenase (EC 1.1.1.95)